MNESDKQMLDDCEIELNNIQKWVSDADHFDSNIKYLSLYSVIKACGTIESIFKKMIYDYLSDGANSEAKKFFQKSILEASYNPSTNKMAMVLGKMSPEMRSEFESKIKNTQQKTQLNSLVELRNNFAHGNPVGASINTIIEYFKAGIWIIEQVDLIVQRISD